MASTRTIKVPEWAAARADKLKDKLRRVGTAALPEAVRPEGELTLGHIFCVGLGRMNELLAQADKPTRRRKR
jgi:hypothetical protein